MTKSSEDVLLQMAEVRYKKGDGTLYIMNERIAWMAENRDTVAVSHHFADIKSQKISPEGKPKVQLQLVLHDGSSSTFHFVNRKGVQATLDDRAKVRELLMQLLPNFKRKVDKDLEEKNRILTENPDLLQLYKDLVITNVLSSEEFWKTCAKSYTMKNEKKQQDVGVPASFLSGIKPIADGCNGLRYQLSGDVIQSIFRTYPAVRRKHEQNVPSKMTESEFWVKFFQSHYFHRDRLTAGTKDIFSDCAKIDELALNRAVQMSEGDALLDLRRMYDVSREEDYVADGGEAAPKASSNIVHQNMIKRFNHHSIMVLQTSASVFGCGGPVGAATAQAINKDLSNGSTEKQKFKEKRKPNNEMAPSELSEKRSCVIQEEAYEDLSRHYPKDGGNNDIASKKQIFSLQKVERFFQGPISTQSYEQGEETYTLDQVRVSLLRQTEAWLQPGQPNKPVVNPHAAVNALGELSPGGALMRGFQEQSTSQLVPPQYEKEIRHLYMSVSRLLKDFWSCYPPNTPELETKIERAHESIKKWQTVKLVPFENRALTDLQPLGASLTKHLNRLLQAVYTKYNNWQNRKQRQKR